jgi:hypothetical protein
MTERNTLSFKLDVTCSRNPGKTDDDEDAYINANVYSRHLVWDALEEQRVNLVPLQNLSSACVLF